MKEAVPASLGLLPERESGAQKQTEETERSGRNCSAVCRTGPRNDRGPLPNDEEVPSDGVHPAFSAGNSSPGGGSGGFTDGKKLKNPNPVMGEAGKWEEYVIYWEGLVKWNGWTSDVDVDALMLSLSRDAAINIHSCMASASSLMRSCSAGWEEDLGLLAPWQMINANCVIAKNKKTKHYDQLASG